MEVEGEVEVEGSLLQLDILASYRSHLLIYNFSYW